VPRRASRRAYLGIGSNLGQRAAHLQAAVDGLAAARGVTVVAVSPVYETEPVGGPAQPDYLNAVVAIDSELDARELLEVARALEAAAGRVRGERWGPRTLDVDLLLLGDERIDEPDLVVPHPRLGERAFVLVPLADLAAAGAGPDPPPWSPPHTGPPDLTGVRRTEVALSVPESP
jgi:2-amino-4-hydroxy-6-hydroxymethyldihydropteridine diphosphokinase